jgi:hypothetical protein
MIAIVMMAAFSQPALAANGAVATQPYASGSPANTSDPAPHNGHKNGHKPGQHKKKSSFKSKMSDKLNKLRSKFPAFLNSFNKGKSQP